MKKIYVAILLLTLCIAKANIIQAQVDIGDSLALVDFYNSTDGLHWTHNNHWLTTAPVKDWYGISISKKNRVTAINLYYNNLNGSIPSSLGNITNLHNLYLFRNKLSGSIPSSLGNLTNLLYLDLEQNQLSGNIPSSFSNFTNIQFFDLSRNNLNGSIPSSIGNFANLQYLYLSENKLSGSIPLELGNLTNVIYLSLNKNHLSGSIPSSFGNLTNIYDLQLNNNQLSGNIPSELGNLANLTFLELNNNQLSGSIPPELSNLNVYSLHLNNNELTGSIPRELGKLKHLYYILDLSNNQLTGNIPAELGKLDLTTLNLSNNQLQGEIPPELGNPYLYTLNLSNNRLTGNIPAELVKHASFKFISLAHNKLTGKIPREFRKLRFVERIYLRDNDLKNAQAFLATLPNLKVLDVENNHFTFDGLETFAQHNFDTLYYREEKKIRLHQNSNTLSVYAGGTLSNNTYKWYKDGSVVSTINGDSTFTPTANGVYYAEVTNSIATALTLQSDTIHYTSSPGLQQNAIAAALNNKNAFSVYPNPAKTNATITFNATGNYTIKFTDINGRIVQTKTGVANKTKNILQLNIGNYAAGNYFITIIDEQNKSQTLKLNKE